MVLSVACTDIPNDLFIFAAWAEGKVEGPELELSFHDLWQLNHKAQTGASDVVKVSCYGLPALFSQYELLPVGATLVTEAGPLVVERWQPAGLGVGAQQGAAAGSAVRRLGIPGRSTTAWALYQHFLPAVPNVVELNYDAVIPALLNGELDAGLLIHDSRDGLEARGMQVRVDLTRAWVQRYHLPLPLGAVVAKKTVASKELTKVLQASADYARAHPDWFGAYCRKKSQFKTEAAVQGALRQWVSSDSVALSEQARKALEVFWEVTQ